MKVAQADITDELYTVPLGEFTAARDALAARLKRAGDKEGAAEVKRIRKPGVPAWAANQVVWHEGKSWERLRGAAAALRKKHEKGSSAEELRDAAREQREAVQACEARAAEWLERYEHAASPAVLQKVGHSLLALAYGATEASPGRLDQDLPPPGFEALAGMTMAAAAPRAKDAVGAPRSRSEPKTADSQHARRQAALAAAESRRAEGKRAVLKARARLSSEEERRGRLESQLEAARAACDEARRQLEEAEAEEASAEAALEAVRTGSKEE